MASGHATDSSGLNPQDDMDVRSPLTNKYAAQETAMKRNLDSLFVGENESVNLDDDSENKRQKLGDHEASPSSREVTPAAMSTTDSASQSIDTMNELASTQATTVSPTSTPCAPTATMCISVKGSAPAPRPEIVDGRVLPYRAFEIEGRPRLAAYHSKFRQAEQLTSDICSEFIHYYRQMKDNGYTNADMEHLVLIKLQKWRMPTTCYPTIKPISLLGPAGIGKSSGSNAYLNQAGIAIESDAGGRGTSVVHEYRSALPNQMHQFMVTVRYLPRQAIINQVEQHCRSVFAFLELTPKDEDELDGEEIQEMQQKHDTGLDFFVTLLRDHEDFASRENASDYFREQTSPSLDSVVDHLVGLIKELVEKRKASEGDEDSYSADDEAALTKLLHNISGPSSPGRKTTEPSVWPLVVTVGVHQENDLLNAGVILGDTPGVTDTNRMVVQNARSYLKEAGTILVFAKPDRIDQNPELDRNLRECVDLCKMEETYLVVTKIDQKATLKDRERNNLLPEDSNKLDEAETELRALKEKVSHAEKAKANAYDADNIQDYKKFEQVLRQLEVDIKSAEMAVKQVEIEIRNRDIARALKDKFREITGSKHSPDLKILFTSNSEYQKHLAGYDVRDPPMLDIEATGIPAVRRLLYKVPAQGKLQLLSRIVRKALPAIFNCISGVLTKAPLERKQEVEDLITRVFERNEEIIMKTAKKDLAAAFKDKVGKTFKDNNAKWETMAEARLEEWARMNGASFAAFPRHGGEWRPAKRPKANWNNELRAIFRVKALSSFAALEDEINVVERHTIVEVDKLYLRLREDLQGCEAFQAVDDTPFLQHISYVEEKLTHDLADLFQEIKALLNRIRCNTALDLVGEESTSFVSIIMQQTYEECKKISAANLVRPKNHTGKVRKKSGVHAARVDEIRKRFKGTDGVTGIFIAVYNEAFSMFESILDGWTMNSQIKMKDASNAVLADFQSRFDTKEVKTEENDEQSQLLMDKAQAAVGVLQGQLEELLLECEAYENA